MKKSNVIVFVLLALASAFFLWLWYFLGLNRVDEPLDLVFVHRVVAGHRGGHRRHREDGAHASSAGSHRVRGRLCHVQQRAGLGDYRRLSADVRGDRGHLAELEVRFSRADFPDKDRFVVKYFVRTKQFEAEEKQGSDAVVDSEQASAGAAKPQIQQKTWTGEVFIVETKEERPFGSPEELARILASLEQAA